MTSSYLQRILILAVTATITPLVAYTPAAAQNAPAKDDHDDHDHDPHETTDAHDDHDDHDAHDDHDHGGHTDEVKLTPDAIARHGITIEPAVKKQLETTFTAPGRVAFNAEAMAHVGSVLAGRVVEIAARQGDTVKKGDTLFVIESAELANAQNEFLQKQTAVTVAELSVEPTRQAYERAKTLHEKNESVPLGEVQKRLAEWKSAEGNVSTAKTSLKAATNTLRIMGLDSTAIDKLAKDGDVTTRAAVHAPIAGQVVEREITLGELVSPDRDALMVIADLSTLWVLADVPETKYMGVRLGTIASIQLPGRTLSFDGKVAFVSASLTADTRTVQVRIEAPNPEGHLKAGMFARVDLTAGAPDETNAAVIAVPRAAVQTVEGSTAVFVAVKGEPNTFAKRAVKLGQPVSGWFPVLEGLKEGESVVTNGTFILKADLGKAGAAHEH